MKELKKIISFLLCFLIAILIFDRAIGTGLEQIFKRTLTGQSGGKINYYLRKDFKPDLLIMGDSRALNQVNPDSFKISAYNISHAGMNDLFQESLLDLVLTKDKKPKYILLHITPEEYIAARDKPEMAAYLKPFYGQAPVLTSYINSSGRYEKIKYSFTAYKFNNIILNILKNYFKKNNLNTNGFEALPVTSFDSSRTIITSREDTTRKNVQLNPLFTERLQRIINSCKKNNVRLIFFTAPLYYKKDMTAYLKIYNAVHALCLKNNCVYFDFLEGNLRKDKFGELGIWTDAYHLNEKGSKIFSGTIAAAVDSLVVGERTE